MTSQPWLLQWLTLPDPESVVATRNVVLPGVEPGVYVNAREVAEIVRQLEPEEAEGFARALEEMATR